MSNNQTQQTQTTQKTTTEAKAPANPFAAFAAFTPSAQMFAPPPHFVQLWTETATRAAEQYATMEKEMIARTQAAVQTWAQLASDAIGYAGQLAVEARKLGLEAVTKVATPAGN